MADGVRRLAEVMDAVSSQPAGIGVTDLAKQLAISKASSSRLLVSLQELGLVERGAEQRYFVGPRLWEWGVQAFRRMRIFEVARPTLMEVVRSSGAMLFLSIARNSDVYFLELLERRVTGVVARPVFKVQPIHTCSAGKAILAYLDNARIDSILDDGLEAFTPNTVVSSAALRQELESVRSRGYAVNRGEYTLDTLGVSVPIFDATGCAIASIASRCSPAEFAAGFEEKMAPVLLDAASTISVYLGYETRVQVGG